MTQAKGHGDTAFEALKRAVAKALDRKRRLGQYAVVWRDGRAVCIGPDAPPMRYPSETEKPLAVDRVAEPGMDDRLRNAEGKAGEEHR